jgi:hemerythrin-like domain-containing protein
VEQERKVHEMRAAVDGIELSDERGDDEYDGLVGAFVLDVQRHIERHDVVLLPALVDACGREEANHIGRQVRYAMETERDGGD